MVGIEPINLDRGQEVGINELSAHGNLKSHVSVVKGELGLARTTIVIPSKPKYLNNSQKGEDTRLTANLQSYS